MESKLEANGLEDEDDVVTTDTDPKSNGSAATDMSNGFVFLKGNSEQRYQVELLSAYGRSFLIRRRFEQWNPTRALQFELYVPALDADMQLVVGYLQGDSELSLVRQRLRDYLQLGYEEEALKRKLQEHKRQQLETVLSRAYGERLGNIFVELRQQMVDPTYPIATTRAVLVYRSADFDCQSPDDMQLLDEVLIDLVHKVLLTAEIDATVDVVTNKSNCGAPLLAPPTLVFQSPDDKERCIRLTFKQSMIDMCFDVREALAQEQREQREKATAAAEAADLASVLETTIECIWPRFLEYCSVSEASGRLNAPFRMSTKFIANGLSCTKNRQPMTEGLRAALCSKLQELLHEVKLDDCCEVTDNHWVGDVEIAHNKATQFMDFQRRLHQERLVKEVDALSHVAVDSLLKGVGSTTSRSEAAATLVPTLWLSDDDVRTLLEAIKKLLAGTPLAGRSFRHKFAGRELRLYQVHSRSRLQHAALKVK